MNIYKKHIPNLVWDGRRRHTPRRFLMRNKRVGQSKIYDRLFFAGKGEIKMARYYVPITIDELREKIEKIVEENKCRDYRFLTPKIEKDLRKVNFSTENIDGNPWGGIYDRIMDYNVIPGTELAVLGISAGGDWQFPVWFCLYYSGTDLRGYVPKNGNAWNHKAKCALGDNYIDYDSTDNEWKNSDAKFAMDLKLFDVEPFGSEEERKKFYIDHQDEIGDALVDINKIIEDIKTRIIKKV